MYFIALFCLLLAAIHTGKSESGCPYPEEILPCVCTNSPTTFLSCQEIDDAEILRNVFINSERYSYKEVHLESSTLQYLPHDMFDKVPTGKIYLKNVSLYSLFDNPPESLESLDTLHIENTVVFRGVIWELLEPLKHLRILNIYYNNIRRLGKDFSKYVTKDLQQLTFYMTNTKSIDPGTFDGFDKLTKVACEACNLTKITRDIFPTPSDISVIYFNFNQISSISDDAFSNMPKLQTLGLVDNQIAFIPESAFNGTGSVLEYLRLDGNPIKCDCRLLWLIQKDPAVSVLTGECSAPKELHGKKLKELTAGNMHC